jgi:zinc D-Ala-D-Ala carboxypeptidase
MKLSEHFTLEEMTRSQTAARKGISNKPNDQAVENLKELCVSVLEPLREMTGSPIGVTSGYRSPKLNAAIGGSPTSQHKVGEAADIHSTTLSQPELFKLIRNSTLPFDQLIDEFGSWVHISYRKPGLNRREVLKARRVGGVVKYTRLSIGT